MLPPNFDITDRAAVGAATGTHFIDITPAQAETILDAMNPDNRKRSKGHVTKLANAMLNNEWTSTGETIKFDRLGNLKDGQHRLSAVVQSGLTIRFEVRFGLSPDVFRFLDQGRTRKPSDILGIEGYDYPLVLSAACRFIHVLESGSTTFDSGSRGSTNNSVVEFVEEHPEVMNSVRFAVHLHSRGAGRVMSAPRLAAFHYLFSKRHTEHANDFIERLTTGVAYHDGDPVLTLRNRFLQSKLGATKMSPQAEVAFVIRAWNAYRKGETLTQLRFTGPLRIDAAI